MKITEQTTLAELAAERQRLGITELHIKVGTDGNRVCSALGPTSGAQCSAKTEAEAIDKAFRRIEAVCVPTAFDHSARTAKFFDPMLGFCVCEHCSKLPEHKP